VSCSQDRQEAPTLHPPLIWTHSPPLKDGVWVYQIYHQVERGSYIPKLISAMQVNIARSRASLAAQKKRHYNMSSTFRASPKPFLLLSCSTLHRASCSSLLYFTSAERKICRLPGRIHLLLPSHTEHSRNKIAYLSRYVEYLHFFAMIVFITVDSENILKHNDFFNSEKQF